MQRSTMYISIVDGKIKCITKNINGGFSYEVDFTLVMGLVFIMGNTIRCHVYILL